MKALFFICLVAVVMISLICLKMQRIKCDKRVAEARKEVYNKWLNMVLLSIPTETATSFALSLPESAEIESRVKLKFNGFRLQTVGDTPFEITLFDKEEIGLSLPTDIWKKITSSKSSGFGTCELGGD